MTFTKEDSVKYTIIDMIVEELTTSRTYYNLKAFTTNEIETFLSNNRNNVDDVISDTIHMLNECCDGNVEKLFFDYDIRRMLFDYISFPNQ